jgi:selenocysteine lyase/cysteine desulfurase
MTRWEEIRSLFPVLDKCTYLNTAGGGPLSVQAAEQAKTYYDEMVADGDNKWGEWLERVEQTRRHLASVLNCTPEEIAFVSNASQGLNLLADMLDRSGEVLTMRDDFPSVTLPWLHRGYSVRFVSSESDGTIPFESLDKVIGPNTKYLVASHVQYRTGFRFNLEELGDFCRTKGLLLALDVTQSFGVVPIDVKRSGIDALVFSGYKWMGAGYGIAPLFVKREIFQSRGLPAVGWRSAKEPFSMINDRLDLTTEARGLEQGHPPFAGIFALRGALQLMEELSLERIEARIHELTDYLHARIDEANIAIRSPRPLEARAGITMVGVTNPGEIAKKLKERNVFVSARGESLRVSLNYYNNRDDIDRFTSALIDVLGGD